MGSWDHQSQTETNTHSRPLSENKTKSGKPLRADVPNTPKDVRRGKKRTCSVSVGCRFHTYKYSIVVNSGAEPKRIVLYSRVVHSAWGSSRGTCTVKYRKYCKSRSTVRHNAEHIASVPHARAPRTMSQSHKCLK